MATVTTRPASTPANSGVAFNGATLHASLNDDSDSTYASSIGSADTASVAISAPSLPGGAVGKTASLRARLARTSAGSTTLQWGTSASTIVTWTSPTTIVFFTTTDATFLAAWASGGVTVSFGLPSDNLNLLRLYELYLDYTYVAQPTTVVTVGGTITDNNLPPVSWVNTLDANGGAQTQYHVKVFTDAQYLAGGFNPASSTPFEDGGQQSGAAASWTPSTIQPNDTYRAYVRVGQTVNGATHWSDWAYDEYIINVPAPNVPTLTLADEPTKARISIGLASGGGGTATNAFEIQRSLDGGTTWEAVRLTTDTDGVIYSGATTTVYDNEAPNGTAMKYRARAGHDYSGVYAWSAWTSTGTETWSGSDSWLKAPESPTLNAVALIKSRVEQQRAARQGIFQPLGRSLAVVVSDERTGATGEIAVWVDASDSSARAKLEALLDSPLTLLLQHPAAAHEDDLYLCPGNYSRARSIDNQNAVGFIYTFQWTEVDEPTGVVDAWAP